MPLPSQLSPGDVVTVDFPAHSPGGHEQEGRRPAVVIGVMPGLLRFPLVAVVPMTTAGGAWQAANPNAYPSLPAGAGGLPKPSIALLDQLRAIDRARIVAYRGTLTAEAAKPIRDGVRRMLEA